jgi:hypothetical protein
MAKVIFDVSEETKIKRRWVFGVLVILLIVSFLMLSFSYPFNREVALAFVISFSVAFILKIIDWVEGSKLLEKKT